MTNKIAIPAVIERLEKAEGPDRPIDAMISMAVGEIEMRPVEGGYAFFNAPVKPGDYAFYSTVADTPEYAVAKVASLSRIYRYTASVDASIALCERILPGWAWSVSKWPGGGVNCALAKCTKEADGQWWHGNDTSIGTHHKTEPLALLLALFKALLAKGEADD